MEPASLARRTSSAGAQRSQGDPASHGRLADLLCRLADAPVVREGSWGGHSLCLLAIQPASQAGRQVARQVGMVAKAAKASKAARQSAAGRHGGAKAV